MFYFLCLLFGGFLKFCSNSSILAGGLHLGAPQHNCSLDSIWMTRVILKMCTKMHKFEIACKICSKIGLN